jgi:hypothetical protein
MLVYRDPVAIQLLQQALPQMPIGIVSLTAALYRSSCAVGVLWRGVEIALYVGRGTACEGSRVFSGSSRSELRRILYLNLNPRKIISLNIIVTAFGS